MNPHKSGSGDTARRRTPCRTRKTASWPYK